MRGFQKIAAILGAVITLGAMGAGMAQAAPALLPTPTTVTAVTHVTNRPDGGNGGTWAYDSFNRTLTISESAVQNPADTTAGKIDYTATVSDQGGFSAIQGNLTPNQVTAGLKIQHAVKGTMNGGVSYSIVAPATDALTGVVPSTENDNFGPAVVTTANWPLQAFASSVGVVVTESSVFAWTYSTLCETWVDANTNGDGNQLGAGNITGQICLTTFPYDGNAHYVAPTREIVNFKSSLTSWYLFRIVGPGAINGHTGWVHALGGGVDNTGVYSGLEGGANGHGYTVDYTPVTGQGSFTPVPFSHGGEVFFVTNQPLTAAA